MLFLDIVKRLSQHKQVSAVILEEAEGEIERMWGKKRKRQGKREGVRLLTQISCGHLYPRPVTSFILSTQPHCYSNTSERKVKRKVKAIQPSSPRPPQISSIRSCRTDVFKASVLLISCSTLVSLVSIIVLCCHQGVCAFCCPPIIPSFRVMFQILWNIQGQLGNLS